MRLDKSEHTYKRIHVVTFTDFSIHLKKVHMFLTLMSGFTVQPACSNLKNRGLSDVCHSTQTACTVRSVGHSATLSVRLSTAPKTVLPSGSTPLKMLVVSLQRPSCQLQPSDVINLGHGRTMVTCPRIPAIQRGDLSMNTEFKSSPPHVSLGLTTENCVI